MKSILIAILGLIGTFGFSQKKSEDRLTRFDPLLFNDQKVKEKYVEKDLLEEFMGDKFGMVEAFAKENSLSFKDKSDFLRILQFYKTLLD